MSTRKTNREKLESKAKELNLNLGSFDYSMELLLPKWIKKVIENIEYQNDTLVYLNKKIHVVEIDIVDNEVDFSLISKEEYIARYGEEFFEMLE